MKILHLLSQTEMTGAETSAITMANYISTMGMSVHIASDTLNVKTHHPFTKIRFNKRALYRRFLHIKKIISLIKTEDIDIIHSHSRASAWVGEWASRLTNTPHIVSVHMRLHTGFTQRLNPCLGDFTLPFCRAVYEQLLKEFDTNPDRMMVFPNMMDCDKYRKQELLNYSDKLTIVFMGRQSGPKGDTINWFMENTIKKLIDFVDLEFLIFGNPSPLVDKQVEDVNDSLNREVVKQMGFTDDVVGAYYNAHLVVGSGRVAIEAMLCGRPVLAMGERSAIGIVKESNFIMAVDTSFGDCSDEVLFNEEFILNDIKDFIQTRDRWLEIVDWGYEEVRRSFCVDALGERLTRLYDELVK